MHCFNLYKWGLYVYNTQKRSEFTSYFSLLDATEGLVALLNKPEEVGFSTDFFMSMHQKQTYKELENKIKWCMITIKLQSYFFLGTI